MYIVETSFPVKLLCNDLYRKKRYKLELNWKCWIYFKCKLKQNIKEFNYIWIYAFI